MKMVRWCTRVPLLLLVVWTTNVFRFVTVGWSSLYIWHEMLGCVSAAPGGGGGGGVKSLGDEVGLPLP